MAREGRSRRQHSLKRIFQRYGIALTNAEYREICSRLEQGEGIRKCETDWGGIVYGITVRGREVNAVWKHGLVVTFYPFGVPMEMQPYFKARAADHGAR